MSTFRKDEFATASHNVTELKAAKEGLYARGFPLAETRDVVARFYDATKFTHLSGLPKDKIVYAVAPSTSRENILPRLFAQHLQSEFGGKIVTDWATPLAVERAAKKGVVGKIREPARFAPNADVLRQISPDATIVLVEDVVTTGQSLRGMREALASHGLRTTEVVSLAQSELRKVSAADINRMVGKLGEDIRPQIETVLTAYSLKRYATFIDRIVPHANHTTTGAIRIRTEIRAHFVAESDRLQQLGSTHSIATSRAGSGNSGDSRVQFGANREASLPSPTIRETVGLRRSKDATENRDSESLTDAQLLETIARLQKEFGITSNAAERAKILNATDTAISRITSAHAGESGAAGLQLRRTAQAIVGGKVEMGALSEKLSSFRNTVEQSKAAHNETLGNNMRIR